MLARPAPAAPAARTLARHDTGEALVDIGNEPETAHFAIGNDVDAGVGLPLDDFGDHALDPIGIETRVERLALLLCLDHRQQIGRPRQAADMRREYPLRALLHDFPPAAGSLARKTDQVSTVRSAVIDGMK